MTLAHPRGLRFALLALSLVGVGCTPNIPRNSIPDEMEFDPQSTPPRVPEPTSLIVNTTTGRLDFSLAGTVVPADCAAQDQMPRAQCEFYQYLQSLDGYPTVTPARAPTTAAALDGATIAQGTNNIVIVDARTGAAFTDVTVGFDDGNRYLTIRPRRSWEIGHFYWLAVRGYAGGVQSASGNRVVGSATQYLLKQETSLTCDAVDAGHLDPQCPAFALLSQSRSPAEAATSVFQLEQIRVGYAMAGAWDRIAAAGLPKAEVAILWGFPIHAASVAELDPTAGLVPAVAAADEIRIAVQGPVDPATVSAFVVRVQAGSVVIMDLTAAATGDLVAGFPTVAASYAGGAIVIKAQQPFVVGHQYGVFLKRTIRNPAGASLVASPISVLLTLQGTLVDATSGRSNVSGVGDADAAMLEAGRRQLAPLFDDPVLGALTGIARQELIYCFAFPFMGPS